MFVDELKDNREWETFLQSSPEGTFYHCLKWKEVLQKSLPISALYLTIRDANGTLVGICPGFIGSSMHMHFFYSTPDSNYGGPIIARHCLKQASLSLRRYLQNFSNNKGIEYTVFFLKDNKLEQCFDSPLSCVDASVGTMEIDLKTTPSKFIWNKIFSHKNRYNIKRFERDGFQAREARSRTDLRDFYNLYYGNMKSIGASPRQFNFLENIWKILYPSSLRLWLVEKNKAIGGLAVFKYGQKTYVDMLGIDKKQSGPLSVFLYLAWKEIMSAEEEGCRYISFGGTPSNPRNLYYRKKIGLGCKFYQQKAVWYPFRISGSIYIKTRLKTVLTWKTIRNYFPVVLKNFLRNKLARF